MQEDQRKTIHSVNDIIKYCKDGEKGYRVASNKVNNNKLKTIFGMHAQQRAEFAAELENEISKIGGTPKKLGEMKGTLHRIWIDIKDTFSGKDERAILTECIRGEEAALKKYDEVITQNENVPDYIKEIISRHRLMIGDALLEMKKLQSSLNEI